MKRFLGSITAIILLSLVFVIGTTSSVSAFEPGDLVITEIMQNPQKVSDANGEWFEIYNASDNTVDLQGFTIKDNGSNSFTIDTSVVIASGGYVVFGRNATTSTNGGITVNYEYSGFYLTNGSDAIILMNGTTEIDRVEYDDGATFPDPTGASMSLAPCKFAEDNNSGLNWCEATSQYNDIDYGTPGATNDLCSVICEPSPPVPEWSTILLMSLGLLGLGTYIVLRKKRVSISI